MSQPGERCLAAGCLAALADLAHDPMDIRGENPGGQGRQAAEWATQSIAASRSLNAAASAAYAIASPRMASCSIGNSAAAGPGRPGADRRVERGHHDRDLAAARRGCAVDGNRTAVASCLAAARLLDGSLPKPARPACIAIPRRTATVSVCSSCRWMAAREDGWRRSQATVLLRTSSWRSSWLTTGGRRGSTSPDSAAWTCALARAWRLGSASTDRGASVGEFTARADTRNLSAGRVLHLTHRVARPAVAGRSGARVQARIMSALGRAGGRPEGIAPHRS